MARQLPDGRLAAGDPVAVTRRGSTAVVATLVVLTLLGTQFDADGADPAFDLAGRMAAHWAWREDAAVQPPPVRDADWPAGDIDRFVLAKLEAADLRPAPPADRVTLIRRLSFDLIGLPPTPQEIDAFVADASADAYDKLVDRLLASPHFGERWARHWLDVVRYAETCGHEADFPIAHAYKYRDYVIRAFNADVPYDRFVAEHIAGDLLPDPRLDAAGGTNESVVATGWWFFHEQTHAPTDVRQHEADRIDNQVDAFGKAFLGLTVGCARCHDHKFDAISAKDYYALAGYLQSSRQQEAHLDGGGRIAAGVAALRAIKADADAALRSTQAPMPTADPSTDRDAQGAIVFEDFNDGTYDGWFTTGWAWRDAATRAGEWDRASGRASPIRPGVAHSGQLGRQLVGTLWSPEFDLTHRQIAMRVCGKGVVRLVIDGYTIEPHVSLLFNGTRMAIDTGGRWRWVVMGGDLPLYAGKGVHRAHLQFIDDDAGAYLAVDEIRFTDGPLHGNGEADGVSPSVAPDADAALAAIAARMEPIAAALPMPTRALAITDGTGEDSRVDLRGSWRTAGDVVPRRLLTAIAGDDQPPLGPRDGSGRLQLARRMLAGGAPFVSRTMVNRIWQHLIGRGIAPTVDNFGVLGEPPTHPQLLDWLSAEFRRDGWSVKRMIRRIVLSSTYQMSSGPCDEAAERADPTNALLHRMNIKRLEGEAIRDAVLAISGRLDATMFGPSVPIHLTLFMGDVGRPKESGPLDGAGRRSVYVEVRRNFMSPMMLAFDTPTPFATIGRRNESNVPAQSLIMMNDPFIVEQSLLWARRAIASEPDAARRVVVMYRQALGRPPGDHEAARVVAFMARHAAAVGVVGATGDGGAAADDERVWADFAHVLLNVKGFVFVE